MAKAIQKRTIETRTRLLTAAREIIDAGGYEAMRVEEVVLRAGTAKGTFFAHFHDKEALMEMIIGEQLDDHLDRLEAVPVPESPAGIASVMMPLCEFMTCERYVFDIILRYSGAAGIEEIGPIARNFGRQVDLFEYWLSQRPYRTDVPAALLADGIHGFMIHAMATRFCALHQAQTIEEQFIPYLQAWLMPASENR